MNYFKGIQYKTVAEIAGMSLEDRRNSYFLYYNRVKIQWGKVSDFFAKIKPGKGDDFLYRNSHMYLLNQGYARIDIVGIDIKDGGTPAEEQKVSRLVMSVKLPKILPGELGMLSGLGYFKNRVEAIKRGEGAVMKSFPSDLRNKTLLICRKDIEISKKFTEEKIDEYYHFNYEVISREELIRKIIEKNEKYCYVIPMPLTIVEKQFSHSVVYTAQVTDISTGDIIIYGSSNGLITGCTFKSIQKRASK